MKWARQMQRKPSTIVPPVGNVACMFAFSGVGFGVYGESKGFYAKFELAFSTDFTGSNRWGDSPKGPGPVDGPSGKLELKLSHGLHHLATPKVIQTIEDANDWTDQADDPYNQKIMPMRRAAKTLSEFADQDGATMSFFERAF